VPDLDGFTVARLLEEAGTGTAVILISSRSASDYGWRLAHSSARGFIPKAELSGPALACLLGAGLVTARRQALVLALMVGCIVAALLPAELRGDHLGVAEVAYELGVGVLFVVAGLLGWARRPESSVGRLLTVAGLAWLAARVLVGAGQNPLVLTTGLVLVVLPIAFLAHLAVAFPSGRLASRLERFIVVSSYVVIIAGVGSLDLSQCEGCPTNLLAVDGGTGFGHLLRVTVLVSTVVVVCAVSVVLVVHWRKGTKAARRVLAPVLPTALLYAVVSAAGLLTDSAPRSAWAGGGHGWSGWPWQRCPSPSWLACSAAAWLHLLALVLSLSAIPTAGEAA
jgi:hypothetical protein